MVSPDELGARIESVRSNVLGSIPRGKRVLFKKL